MGIAAPILGSACANVVAVAVAGSSVALAGVFPRLGPRAEVGCVGAPVVDVIEGTEYVANAAAVESPMVPIDWDIHPPWGREAIEEAHRIELSSTVSSRGQRRVAR